MGYKWGNVIPYTRVGIAVSHLKYQVSLNNMKEKFLSKFFSSIEALSCKQLKLDDRQCRKKKTLRDYRKCKKHVWFRRMNIILYFKCTLYKIHKPKILKLFLKAACHDNLPLLLRVYIRTGLVGWLIWAQRPFETEFQSISGRLLERGRKREK